jgi:hypothetical protein
MERMASTKQEIGHKELIARLLNRYNQEKLAYDMRACRLHLSTIEYSYLHG